jgi:hypothetical protein
VEPNPPSARCEGSQLFSDDEVDALHLLEHELRDAVSRLYDLGLAGEVYQQNLNFSAVVAVDRAGRVETGKTLF